MDDYQIKKKDMSALGQNLRDVDYISNKLPPFEKVFYK